MSSQKLLVTVKRHRGEPGHTRDTQDTRAQTGTRITQTNLTTIQTQRHTRTTTRRPKPRPSQQPQERPQARSRPLPAVDWYRYCTGGGQVSEANAYRKLETELLPNCLTERSFSAAFRLTVKPHKKFNSSFSRRPREFEQRAGGRALVEFVCLTYM